jgi:hypothetical protein
MFARLLKYKPEKDVTQSSGLFCHDISINEMFIGLPENQIYGDDESDEVCVYRHLLVVSHKL